MCNFRIHVPLLLHLATEAFAQLRNLLTNLDYIKMRMSKIFPRFAFSLIAFYLASCSLQEKAAQLDPFAAINPLQKFNPLAPDSPLAASVVAQWEKDFSQPGFLQSGDRWHTRQGRDELVYRLIFIADYRFSRYEANLMAGRAAGDTVVDMAVLGLTSAAALTTPGQATQILAAIAGGLIGSRAAVQKNFFQNQTTLVLLDRMRALRKERFNEIVANLRLSYERYPVELAIVEVFDYYNRGTMLGALQDISTNTAIKQIKAEGGDVRAAPVAPPASKQIPVSLPQAVSTKSGPLITIKLPPDVRRRRKILGGEIVNLERDHDAATASKILENFGLVPVPQGQPAIDKLRNLVAGIQSEKDLIPLERAFSITLKQAEDRRAGLPQENGKPTPATSATPSLTPIPVSTPQDVHQTDGSIKTSSPTPIPVSTPQDVHQTEGSIKTSSPTPIPISTPQDVHQTDGSIKTSSPTPIPISTPHDVHQTDGSINGEPKKP